MRLSQFFGGVAVSLLLLAAACGADKKNSTGSADGSGDSGEILPRASELDGFDSDGFTGIGEEFGEGGGGFVGAGFCAAGADGLADGGEGAGSGGGVEAFVQDLLEELIGFAAGAGLADHFDPGTGAIAGQRFVAEELAEHFAGAGGFDGLECELELFVVTFAFPFAALNRGDPDGSEIVDGEPERVIQVFVGGLGRAAGSSLAGGGGRECVDGGQGESGGLGGGDAREGSQGFDADAG